MYSVNGVALDNDAQGWWLSAKSSPFPGVTSRVTQVTVPGRAGAVVARPVEEPRAWPLVLSTSVGALDGLYALFGQWPLIVARTDDASRVVECTRLSMSAPVLSNRADDDATHVEVQVLLQVDSAYWRDAAVSTVDKTLTTSTTLDVFPGLSGVVDDALVKIKGPVWSFQITNTVTGAVVSYPLAVAESQAVVFDLEDQSARRVSATSWNGGTDVSGDVDFTGPILSITPTFTDPAARKGRLKVDATGVDATSRVYIRGKGAYLHV